MNMNLMHIWNLKCLKTFKIQIFWTLNFSYNILQCFLHVFIECSIFLFLIRARTRVSKIYDRLSDTWCCPQIQIDHLLMHSGIQSGILFINTQVYRCLNQKIGNWITFSIFWWRQRLFQKILLNLVF